MAKQIRKLLLELSMFQ